MKLRFVAAAGPAAARLPLEHKLDSREGAGLRKVHSSTAMSVWVTDDTPYVSAPDGKATLVGMLFDGATSARVTALPDISERGLAPRSGFWGAYVLLTGDGPCHSVRRDPSGSVPVYYGSAGDVDVYASDADLLSLAWPEPFDPDLESVRHWLSFPFLRTWRCGAKGVRELLPGACRSVDPSGERVSQPWSPFDHGRTEMAVTDFNEAAAMLREAILRTVPGFAPVGEDVVLHLSGGLDSSIVAAALSHAGVRFHAVTFATRSADGDERRFAREVAARFGIGLTELVEDGWVADFDTPCSPLRPPPNPLLQPLHRALSLQAVCTGAGVVLDGAGGDNMFAYLNTASPALDALRMKGPTCAFRTLRDIASLHGCTFWSAARAAVRRARRGAAARWPRHASFLTPDGALAEPDEHPWLSAAAGLLPGASDHIRMIVGIHHFLSDPQPGLPASLHPLLAQPLMELCLRIPTWLWIAGGRDRSVARAAFRGLVPDAVLERRGKGRLESLFIKGYMAARSRLEDMIVGGRLVERGIVDARAVSAYLRQPGQPGDARYIRILEIAGAEQWLRSFGR